MEDLLKVEHFENVWECACGAGHLSEVLKKYGIHGRSSDLFDRGYSGAEILDFRRQWDKWDGDILTNPPFRYAQEFVEKGLECVNEGRKVAMLLRIQFLEGKKRRNLFREQPPQKICVWSERIACAMNGDFISIKHGSPMMFAWFVWVKGFQGDPIIKWL